MAKYLIAVALVALAGVNVASAFGPYGMGYDGNVAAAIPAAAAGVDSLRATGHAVAAENRATEAAVDRATGNPIGAAINENRAVAHQAASSVAAGRSAVEAGMAGGLAGSAGAALGANVAANAASRTVGGVLGGVGPYGYGLNAGPYGPYGYNSYPGAYGAGYGYPYGAYGPGYAGPLGYGAGMNRAIANGAAAATGAAVANGIASAAGMNAAGLGAASRIAALV